MPQPITIWGTVKRAYGLILGQQLTFWRLAGPPVLFSFAGVLVGAVLPYGELIVAIVLMIGAVHFQVRWLRYGMIGETKPLRLQLWMPEMTRFLFGVLVLNFLLALILRISSALIFQILEVSSSSQQQLILLTLLLLLALIYLRLWMALIAIALNRPWTLGAIWRATQGHSGALFWAILFSVFPFFLAMSALSFLQPQEWFTAIGLMVLQIVIAFTALAVQTLVLALFYMSLFDRPEDLAHPHARAYPS